MVLRKEIRNTGILSRSAGLHDQKHPRRAIEGRDGMGHIRGVACSVPRRQLVLGGAGSDHDRPFQHRQLLQRARPMRLAVQRAARGKADVINLMPADVLWR